MPRGVVKEGDEHISLIIIDGYNLIGISHDNLGAERDKLIRVLSEYRKKKGHDITVVFDGWKSGGRSHEIQTVGGVKVIYTRLGDTADSVIKMIVGGEKKEWIVVTSDRDIVSFAWANGSVAVSSERFSRLLSSAGSVDGEDERRAEHDVAEGVPDKRKGRQRTPSRKERTLARVLKKL